METPSTCEGPALGPMAEQVTGRSGGSVWGSGAARHLCPEGGAAWREETLHRGRKSSSPNPGPSGTHLAASSFPAWYLEAALAPASLGEVGKFEL